MIYIVFHSADFDGLGSAVITASGLGYDKERRDLFEFIPYNYQQKLMFDKEHELIEVIKDGDLIFFVDCFYTKDLGTIKEMIDVIGKENLYVIDHHETSLNWISENCPEVNWSSSENSSDPNNRIGEARSAIALCWNHFFGEMKMPRSIKLLSNYDAWYNDDEKEWNESILPYQYGLRNENFNTARPWDEYDRLLDILLDEKVTEAVINNGKVILSFIKSESKALVAKFGREIKVHIDGDETVYNAFIAPGHLKNSMVFDGMNEEDKNKFDIFILDRSSALIEESYISIISNKPDIDVSKLAEKLGGGGHRKISGCAAKFELELESDIPLYKLVEIKK